MKIEIVETKEITTYVGIRAPRTYSLTHYVGPISQTETAYHYTSRWMSENGYTFDDVAYYFERYDEKTIIDDDNEKNEIKIYCPIKKR